MSDKETPVIDADTVEASTQDTAEETKATPKKRINFKLHFMLTLILGVATWAFITYSPVAQQWQARWVAPLFAPSSEAPLPDQAQASNEPAMEDAQAANVSDAETYDSEPATDTNTVTSSPIFAEDALPQAEQATMPAMEETITTDSPEATPATPQDMQDLANQVATLTANIQQLTQRIEALQHQQRTWAEQQVRAQLFALLQTAASAQSSLQDALTAWKSIGFLPLLHEEKRDTAKQAFTALQGVQQNMQNTLTEIQSLIRNLADSMHPKAVKEVAEEVGGVVDPYQQTDTWTSWLDWLKAQFVITKLDKHALELSDDPYADIKQLIVNLNALQQAIAEQRWQDIGSLTPLLYQLEQRGFEPGFSNESLRAMQDEIQHWQDEAKTWVNQL